jgi:L-alanine-DL-glutamate epimerase-like enolase superfamily enzyme
MAPQDLDRVLEKLAKDVENAVHALYRGEVRQQTARTRTGGMIREAQAAIQQALADAGAAAASGASVSAMPSPRPSVAGVAAVGESVGWTREEGEAVLKCITAWLPMGPPKDAPADSKCVSAMRELTPTWGQREKAREAVKRVSAS